MPFDHGPSWLVGGDHASPRCLQPFAPEVCGFLAALSTELRSDRRARQFPDVQTFAFWCRAGNLARLKASYEDAPRRLGLGLLFHVTPGNVPVNFAYSFAFGLLAGNSNIVRVPSLEMPQVDIICGAIDRLLGRPEHAEIGGMAAFARYGRDSAWTAKFSAKCDGRIIWGGDEAVAEFRKIPLPPRSIELTFADRYSLCVIEARSVGALSDKALAGLAEAFYNDTYLMDQNACASPHLVVWLGAGDGTEREIARRFWQALAALVETRYPLEPVQAVEKYTRLLSAVIEDGAIADLRRFRNSVYTIELAGISPGVERRRGRFGLFWEFHANRLDCLLPLVTRRFQTLTYFGVGVEALRDFVIGNRLSGIDRIVPVGKALDIDILWDGYDLIRQLSRIIDAR